MTTPRLMTLPEAARYLGRSPWWMRKRVADGEIPSRMVGCRFFISRADLDRWLDGEVFEIAAPALGVPSPRGARRGG